jgi:hypothetical protein
MKLIVAGGRDFDNYARMCVDIEELPFAPTSIVCGECRGADLLGRRWAEEHGVQIDSFPARWVP